MAISSHKYSNGQITILWQPGLCIHSAICAKGLRPVFDPVRRPWIDMGQSDTKTIVAQVSRCPSGALSIVKTGNK